MIILKQLGTKWFCAIILLFFSAFANVRAQTFVYGQTIPYVNKQVTIQPVQIFSGATFAPISINESLLDKVWSQAGIDIKVNSTIQWQSPFSDNYMTVDSEVGPTNSLLGLAQRAGQPWSNMASSTIVVFFVNALTANGSGGLAGTTMQSGVGEFGEFQSYSFGAIAIGALAKIDTLAHEIGHSLALDHTVDGKFFGSSPTLLSSASNLMTDGLTRTSPSSLADIFPDGGDFDQLSSAQVSLARSFSTFVLNHPQPAYYNPIPEPSVYAIVAGIGSFFFAFFRRSQRSPDPIAV